MSWSQPADNATHTRMFFAAVGMAFRRLMPVLLGLGGALAVRGETVTGTFRFADFNPANQSTTNRPIQFCRVDISTFRPRGLFNIPSWGVEQTTGTDVNGAISVTMFQVPGVPYKVTVFAENYAVMVLPNQISASGSFWQEAGFPDGAAIVRSARLPTDVLDFSYDFRDANTPQYWSLADAVRRGFDYVAARRDPAERDALQQATVHPGYAGVTFYNPVNQTLEINNMHVWEDYTIVHEYAHYVEHHIGSFVAIAANHDGCIAKFGDLIINSPEHAWMEGFANFLPQVVASKNPPGTLLGHAGGFGTFTVFHLENTPWEVCLPPVNITASAIENVVAGVLWDVYDPPGDCGTSEAHDALADFDTAIIQILDHELDFGEPLPRGPSIEDFHSAWLARGLPAGPWFDILRHHQIVPPLPPARLLCAGDITADANPTSCRASVTFAAPVLEQPNPCAIITCNPASGATFATGTTTVSCRARESGTNVATCSFQVTVRPSSSLPDPHGTGLLGVYYDNMDFTAARLARTEAVDFDWGLSAPDPSVGADTFSVRWSGQIVPRYIDTYRFYTVSDDGVRLWVDGRLIVNQWNDHGPTEHSNTIFLEAGQAYSIVLEMYENSGGATARLLWESTCQAKEIIPASHLLPARLECPVPNRPTYTANFVSGLPVGTALFGQAVVDAGWIKLTRADTAFGIVYIDNFSGTQSIHGFEAKFTASLFGSACCGAFPADGFSFNLVPAGSARPNPVYGQPAEEGLDEGLAINFDTWDNGGGEAPAVEVKWLGQVIARRLFQVSQSAIGITSPRAAAREVLINLSSDGILNVSYGGVGVLENVQTPYTPLVIGIPKWIIGARNGGANDNHWIRDLQIIVNQAQISQLFNTGTDNLGHPLLDNASDPHYVMPVPRRTPPPAIVATSAGGFPIGPWLPDDAASAWIAPLASTLDLPDVTITYETIFDLKGLIPTSAAIYGWAAADNQLVDILLNGQSTGQTAGQFVAWNAFALTSGFVSGVNTLTFVTRNGSGGDNPTGLRVEMRGWAAPPPLLKLNIAYDSQSTTLQWGSLPHKQYFVEHSDNPSGPWVRVPGTGLPAGSYRSQFIESVSPATAGGNRFYRIIEAP